LHNNCATQRKICALFSTGILRVDPSIVRQSLRKQACRTDCPDSTDLCEAVQARRTAGAAFDPRPETPVRVVFARSIRGQRLYESLVFCNNHQFEMFGIYPKRRSGVLFGKCLLPPVSDVEEESAETRALRRMEKDVILRENMRLFRDRLDAAAFDQIADDMTRPALGVARQLLRDEPLAEDAVQEAFLRIIRHRRRYNPARPFQAWFYTILRNICRDMHRSRVRHDRALAGAVIRAPRVTPPPDPALLDVRELLHRLPDETRSVLELRVIEGLGFREVAAALGISEEAAKKRAQRALRKLRTLCRRQDPDESEAEAAPLDPPRLGFLFPVVPEVGRGA
jgi:RNA polymerase sigma-70 factor (ECF subfamily)